MPPNLHAELETQLARWSLRLADTLGDALRAVVLFGGLAKGEFVPGQSDVNVAVILRQAGAEVLDRAAPLLQQGALGNLFETPLRVLYREHPILHALRNPQRPPRGCEPCAFRRTCRGGLRCLAQAVNRDATTSDPGCWLATGRSP